MPRASSIHALGPRRSELDAALLRGESDVLLSKQFGVSVHAIGRYKLQGTDKKQGGRTVKPRKKQPPTEVLLAAKEIDKLPMDPQAVVAGSLDPLQELEALYRTGGTLLKAAQDGHQFGASVAAVGRLTKILETISKLTGELNTGSTTIHNTQITIESVSTRVQQVALNFADAPPEVRAWAASNMLNGAG